MSFRRPVFDLNRNSSQDNMAVNCDHTAADSRHDSESPESLEGLTDAGQLNNQTQLAERPTSEQQLEIHTTTPPLHQQYDDETFDDAINSWASSFAAGPRDSDNDNNQLIVNNGDFFAFEFGNSMEARQVAALPPTDLSMVDLDHDIAGTVSQLDFTADGPNNLDSAKDQQDTPNGDLLAAKFVYDMPSNNDSNQSAAPAQILPASAPPTLMTLAPEPAISRDQGDGTSSDHLVTAPDTTPGTPPEASKTPVKKIISNYAPLTCFRHNRRFTVGFCWVSFFRTRFLQRRLDSVAGYTYVVPTRFKNEVLAVLEHQVKAYGWKDSVKEALHPLSVISEFPGTESYCGVGCAHCLFLTLHGRGPAPCSWQDQPGNKSAKPAEACRRCIDDGYFCIVSGLRVASYDIDCGAASASDTLPAILPLPMDHGDESGEADVEKLGYWIDKDNYDAYR